MVSHMVLFLAAASMAVVTSASPQQALLSSRRSPSQYLRSSTDLPRFMAVKGYTADTTSGNGMCMQFKLGFMGIINVEVGLGLTLRKLVTASTNRAEIEFMGAIGGSVGAAGMLMGSLSGAVSGRISGVAPIGKFTVKGKEFDWSPSIQSMWLFKKWLGWYVVQTPTYRGFASMISYMKPQAAQARWALLGKSMAEEVEKEIKVVTNEITSAWSSASTAGTWYATMPGMNRKTEIGRETALVSGLMEKALKVAKYLHQMFVIEVQKLAQINKKKGPSTEDDWTVHYVEKAWRTVYMSNAHTPDYTKFTISPKCNDITTPYAGQVGDIMYTHAGDKKVQLMVQRMVCQWGVLGVFVPNAAGKSGGNYNIRHMMKFMYPELYQVKRHGDGHVWLSTYKNIFDQMVDDQKGAEPNGKCFEKKRFIKKLADVYIKGDTKAEPKAITCGKDASKCAMIPDGIACILDTDLRTLSEQEKTDLKKSVKASEMQFFGHMRVLLSPDPGTGLHVTVMPAGMPKSLMKDLGEMFSKPVDDDEGDPHNCQMEAEVQWDLAATVGADPVGYCTPDSNTLQVVSSKVNKFASHTDAKKCELGKRTEGDRVTTYTLSMGGMFYFDITTGDKKDAGVGFRILLKNAGAFGSKAGSLEGLCTSGFGHAIKNIMRGIFGGPAGILAGLTAVGGVIANGAPTLKDTFSDADGKPTSAATKLSGTITSWCGEFKAKIADLGTKPEFRLNPIVQMFHADEIITGLVTAAATAVGKVLNYPKVANDKYIEMKYNMAVNGKDADDDELTFSELHVVGGSAESTGWGPFTAGVSTGSQAYYLGSTSATCKGKVWATVEASKNVRSTGL